MQKLKLLNCIDTLLVGGAERVAVDICNLLNDNDDYESSILVLREEGPLISSLNRSVSIKILNIFSKFSLFGWLKLIFAIRGFDIIHVHMRHTYARVKLAALLSFNYTPIIFHDHYGDIDFDRKVPVFLKFFLKPKFYVGVSQNLTKWALTDLKISKENIWVLPNTIYRNFEIDNQKKNDKKIILVSNIRKTKNIEFAINLMNFLPYSLDIYGQVIDRKYFEYLKEISNGLPINFITNENDIFPHINKYFLAIHCAKSETGPLVLMEYLKAGINFITYDTGEVVNQLKGTFRKSVLNDFKTKNWINAINLINEQPYSEKELQHFFNKNFSPDAYLKKLIKIYKCIMKN